MDFLQYYEHIEDMECAASVCIGSEGDMHNVPTANCPIRMAMAGTHVCINCINFLVQERSTRTTGMSDPYQLHMIKSI